MTGRILLDRSRPRGLPAWLLTVLASMVLGTWLVAAHPIVHLHPDAGHAHGSGSLKALFGQHGSAADCLAFDHQHLGDALPVQSQVTPESLPAAPQPWTLSPPQGRAVRPAFWARGPPVIRSFS